MSARLSLLLSILPMFACGPQDNPGADASTSDRPDAAADGCSAMSPRTVAPEVFVGPGGLQQRLTALIDSAQDSLDLHMYLFTMRPLADRLIAAKNRGVDVRVILDPDHEGNPTVRSQLLAANVPTRDNIQLFQFAHAKYMIIDGTTSVIMSNNFNFDAMDTERNYGMVDRDGDDIEDLEAIFNADWAAAGGGQVQPADLSCTRLIVSPTNSKQRIVELIDSATRTLEVELMYLSEMSVRTAIGAAKQRGVDVRVILGDRTDESVAYLRGLGVTVKFPSTFYMHAKLIVADDVAFIGSENMSLTSLTRNREVGALVFESAGVTVVNTQFDRDWISAAQN